jgi:stage V sporulation protein SpoVS
VVGVITEQSSAEIQYLGAHAAHLDGAMARGFTVEQRSRDVTDIGRPACTRPAVQGA